MKLRQSLSLSVLLIWIVAAISFASYRWMDGGRAGAVSGGARTVSAPQDAPTPPTKITSALATVPPDYQGFPSQGDLDLFSWLNFIALNWPTTTANTCGPNTGASILDCKTSLGCTQTVWETYLQDTDVFVPKGSTPSPWCPPPQARLAHLPQSVRQMAQKAGVTRVFRHLNKATELKEELSGIDEAFGGPLTDQNGRFVRYEIHLNKDEYQYIMDPSKTGNKTINLWSQAGQQNFAKSGGTISFPLGNNQTKVTGAIEIKAAWKVLTPAEQSSNRFYAIKALVFNDDANPPKPSPGPNPVTLGLVGLHLIHKTTLQSRWVWSTFEQVDNLTKSFYNPNCTGCTPNQPTQKNEKGKDGKYDYYAELDPKGNPLTKPVQVVRINPIQAPPTQLNSTFQSLLAGSVWANYQLVSTQWLGELGMPEPEWLANMTLETFVQGPNPPSDGLPNGQLYNPLRPDPRYQPFQSSVSSSCMKCHNLGKDFSFLPDEAN